MKENPKATFDEIQYMESEIVLNECLKEQGNQEL